MNMPDGYVLNERKGERRRRKREKRYIFLAAIGFALLTILEVSLSELSSRLTLATSLLFFIIVNLNVILLGLLVFLVFRNFVKLFLERRGQFFGSKLKTKLIVVFVSLAIIPTIILFTISAFYIHNSFGSWFNSQIKTSLEGSVDVSEAYYEQFKIQGKSFSQNIASFISREHLLNPSKKEFLIKAFKDFQDEYQLASIELHVPESEKIEAFISPKYRDYSFPRPPQNFVSHAMQGTLAQFVQKIGQGNLIRTFVPVFTTPHDKKPVAIVGVSFFIPLDVAQKIEKIFATHTDYEATSPFASSIQSSYFIILVLMTLLIIFTALWFGFYLARHLITPIKNLAYGTKEIARGNLDVFIHPEESRFATDEFDILFNSFNKMTADLRENRAQLARAHDNLKKTNRELNQRRQYIEAILKNIAAGIVSLDAYGRVTTINKSMQDLFQIDAEKVMGQHYRDVVGEEYIKYVDEFMCEVIADETETIHKRHFSITLHEKTYTILASIATVRDENSQYVGMVVVLEDLTDMIAFQRTAAWQEIAKRIAHEIKNPLTPIKLSAQRLKKKFSHQGGEVFNNCVDTIITQVDGLKDMINDFSDFAKLPQPRFSKQFLSDIVKEVIGLYAPAHEKVQFTFQEKEPLPLVEIDRDQIKRVFINLVDNAVTAMKAHGTISIMARYNRILDLIIIDILDEGPGIDPKIKRRLFEPYFTTKKKGGGLGLAIVQKIIQDHHGIVRVGDNQPQGTKFTLELPVEQSTNIMLPLKESDEKVLEV